MRKKVKILLTDTSYLRHNYGAQALAFPLKEKLNGYFQAEYSFIFNKAPSQTEKEFCKKHNFTIIVKPGPMVMLGQLFFPLAILYNLFLLFKGRSMVKKQERAEYLNLVNSLKDNDLVIDLSGIEFIEGVNLKRRWLNFVNIACVQHLAEKYRKPYLKYTKSYGPFSKKIYSLFVQWHLNKLPFVMVRGKNNLENVQKINLRVPVYNFPDISIIEQPAPQDWAVKYLSILGIEPFKEIIGLSPSTVFVSEKITQENNLQSLNHIKLYKALINFFQQENKQILLIPHSIENGKDWRLCGLALCKKIYTELKNKRNVFVVTDDNLTYKQVRAIIGLVNFYITSRYHALCSGLCMGVPSVALSWHIKYKDLLSLFLDDFLIIDYRVKNIDEALLLVKKYYDDQTWFNKSQVFQRKTESIKQINQSIKILTATMKKLLKNKNE